MLSEGFYAIAPAIFDRLERNVELGYTEEDMGTGIELAFQKLDMAQTLADLQSDHTTSPRSTGRWAWWGTALAVLLTWLSSCNLEQVAAASAYYGGGIPDQRRTDPEVPRLFSTSANSTRTSPMDSVAQRYRANSPTCRCTSMPRTMALTATSAALTTRLLRATLAKARTLALV